MMGKKNFVFCALGKHVCVGDDPMDQGEQMLRQREGTITAVMSLNSVSRMDLCTGRGLT
jgi:hypothetical protein